MWRANRLFLWVVSAKVRQVFETTKFLEKFFLPIDFWAPKARIKKASRSAQRASHHIDSASVSINCHRHQTPTMYRTLPTTLSLELRMQRYNNFLKPPNFRRSFFRAPRSCVLYLLYIGAPSVTLTNKTWPPLIRLRHFRSSVLLSCECKGTTTFPIYQMFEEVFSAGDTTSQLSMLMHRDLNALRDEWRTLRPSVTIGVVSLWYNGRHLAVIQRTLRPSVPTAGYLLCCDTTDALPLDPIRASLL